MGNGGGELTLKRQMGMDCRTVEWAITGELEICSLVFYLCHSFVIVVIMRSCFIIVDTYSTPCLPYQKVGSVCKNSNTNVFRIDR